MAFINDIITAVTGDTSINTYASGGIVYEHLPVDFDSSKDWIVFSYTNEGVDDSLDVSAIFSHYALNIQVVSTSLNTVSIISDRIKTYLSNYDSGGLRDISLLDDDIDKSLEKGVYYNTMNFTIIYEN